MTPDIQRELHKSQENAFNDRITRLPDGLRKHIRELKKNGQLEKAFKVRERFIKDKHRPQNTTEQLHFDTATILLSPDPHEVAESAFRATWITSLAAEESREVRAAKLNEVYSAFPEAEDHLAAQAQRIAAEVARMANQG